MELLAIEATKSTPVIRFDPHSGILNMGGESYPENSFEFFRPVLSWLSRFSAVHNGPVTLNLHLSYLNTGSTKCLMDMLDLLEESFLKGNTVAVNWFCDADNDRAVETAEEFKEEVTLPFQILPLDQTP